MPEFWYSALTNGGVVKEGMMTASSEHALADELRAGGSFLIRTEIREGASTRSGTLTDGKIERRDLLSFLEYVAGSFDVGIPMLDTLDDVVKRMQSRKLKKIIGELRFAISDEGKSLSAALAEHPVA